MIFLNKIKSQTSNLTQPHIGPVGLLKHARVQSDSLQELGTSSCEKTRGLPLIYFILYIEHVNDVS